MTGLCRDCLADVSAETVRCRRCGGPRILRHPELATLAIAHIDCDAFYASIEKRDRPELAAAPVIIGGGRRGVVAAACYVARTYGVRSAMPMFKALKLCPDAVVIRPDMEKYARAGREVRGLMRSLTPLVEPLALDEASLDLSGTERALQGIPAASLARLARQIENEIGLTVSVGLSYCKFLAKIASDLDKPRGFAVIGRAEAKAFLADKPVTLLPGVGKAAAAALARDGIHRIGQLQGRDVKLFARSHGPASLRLLAMAKGIDDRRVEPEGEAKSVSAETTFNDDLDTADALEPMLWHMCERVAARLKKDGVGGRTVTLKLKTAAFRSVTRSVTQLEPVQLAEDLFATARPLLRREIGREAFRLLGVDVSHLEPAAPGAAGLFDGDRRRKARTEAAMDAVRARFGRSAILKGRGLTRPR